MLVWQKLAFRPLAGEAGALRERPAGIRLRRGSAQPHHQPRHDNNNEHASGHTLGLSKGDGTPTERLGLVWVHFGDTGVTQG